MEYPRVYSGNTPDKIMYGLLSAVMACGGIYFVVKCLLLPGGIIPATIIGGGFFTISYMQFRIARRAALMRLTIFEDAIEIHDGYTNGRLALDEILAIKVYEDDNDDTGPDAIDFIPRESSHRREKLRLYVVFPRDAAFNEWLGQFRRLD